MDHVLKLIEVEQRDACTKQKNTSVRQRQKIESLIEQNSREEKRKTKKERVVSLTDQNENPRKTEKIQNKIRFENNLTAFALKHAQGVYLLIGSFQSSLRCRLKYWWDFQVELTFTSYETGFFS